MEFRKEYDSMGEILVDASKYWGSQTQRSYENFKIGTEQMPNEVIMAFAYLKKACAYANHDLVGFSKQKAALIATVCDEIISHQLDDHFPLVVWQTGSGTQSNMNVNEVISNRGNEIIKSKLLHPNDDVNKSQSSNDTFPSAMHIAAVLQLKPLLKSLKSMIDCLYHLEMKNKDIIKIGRTHLQDATPLRFSDEISGWRSSLENNYQMIENSLTYLSKLAIGGTAVGSGLNAPDGFSECVCEYLNEMLETNFISDPNKFHALTSKDDLVFAHASLKALACNLMKMANDIRFLASGPRCGIGEIKIPENEPGSSIMPGKVNPTQCEAVTMVALQVMGNDTSIAFAASQGNFELNVFMPLIIYNFIQSTRLLNDVIVSFEKNCVAGIVADQIKMKQNLENSLMLVTALNPYIGYEKGAKCAKKAYQENITLKQACLQLGYLTEEEYDLYVDPNKMVK